MTNVLIPKVSITEGVGNKAAVGGLGQTVIGIIGTSEKGTANTVQTINSQSDAIAIFGSNTAYGANLLKMIKKAFLEGASKIVAISVGTPNIGTTPVVATLTADFDPATATNKKLIATSSTAGLAANDVIYLGTGNDYSYEERLVIQSVAANSITVTTDIQFKHYIGEKATKVTEKVSADYDTAIDLMTEEETKAIVICEDNSSATAAKIVTLTENSYALHATPCIYIQGPELADTASTVVTKAQATNNKRVVMVYPNLVDFNGKILTGGETAAVVAGAIVGNGIPKLNHNFTEFVSVGGVASKIVDADTLIQAGVTPILVKWNDIVIARFLTTNTKKLGVPDKTWLEAAVRLNVDYIEKAIQRRLQTKFLQSGNTPETRLAIKMECISLLETFASSQIIVADSTTGTPAYKDPIVQVNASDDTAIDVQIELSPAKPLNFITLNFKVLL